MRQVVLDTETTGLDPAEGHRIIEIGCVELVNRRLTGNRFHVYLNPERDIDPGAVEVHGLSSEFLADKPRFADIADDFLAYIKGAELIIHNAPFDIGFLDHELQRLPSGLASVTEYCTVIDTLVLAKKKHPGQRNSLDALCKRYNIVNRHRELHGALLDAEILAEVYLAMTGGQTLLVLEPEPIEEGSRNSRHTPKIAVSANRPSLKVIRCNETEFQAHLASLETIRKASNGKCLWKA